MVTTISGTSLSVPGNITTTNNGNITSAGDVEGSSFNGGQLGGRRNLIINGAMQVAQRVTSEAGVTSGGYYTVDRMQLTITSGLGEWTVSQDTDAPTEQGFSNSMKLSCTQTSSLGAAQAIVIRQYLEGQNLQHLKKGTSNAESLTASFWVKTNKTGTYAAELRDADNARTISKTFTVDAAGTWEKKTLTFAGDTTGTLDNDNQRSFDFNIWLTAGTDFTSGTLQTTWGTQTNANRAVGLDVNLADSTSNYINITGVQLEVGDTATPFEHRSYAEELALCYRYYQKYPVINATSVMFTALAVTGTQARASIRPYGGLMRDEPSIYTPTNVYLKGNGNSITVTSVAASSSEGGGHAFNFNVTSGLNANYVYYVTGTQSGGVFELDAELT